jgi:hypothetical protein
MILPADALIRWGYNTCREDSFLVRLFGVVKSASSSSDDISIISLAVATAGLASKDDATSSSLNKMVKFPLKSIY